MMLLKFKCITVLAFLILECYVLSLSASLNIERGERDVFDNPNCDTSTEVGCNCGDLEAACLNPTCKRCKCSEAHGTFVPSNDTNDGQCVKNRHLLFIPASSNSFLVQQTQCMKPVNLLHNGVYYMIKTVCNETDPTQRWVWTQRNHLMNVAFWKCLESYYYGGFSYLILSQTCSNTATQFWKCQGQTFSLKTRTLKLFTNSRKTIHYVLGTSGFNKRDLWTRYLSRENFCAKGSCDVKTTQGECCVFPFRYDKANRYYYSCTTVDNGNTPWCATNMNYSKWGNCSEALSSSFLFQSKKCMIPNNGYLAGTTCNVNNANQHWIWTRNNQLMHVDTLKCLQQSKRSINNPQFWHLFLQECNSIETKQFSKCQGKTFSLKNNDTINLYTSDRAWGTTYYKQALSRYSSGKYLCSIAFGCYEFVNPSSAVLLTDTRNCPQQCFQEREISVPHNTGESLCFVMWEKLEYLNNDQWKQLSFRDEIFIINKKNTRTFLQLNFRKFTNRWIGLIVKLYFYCAEKKITNINPTDIKCVVVKFEGIGSYPPIVLPTTKVPIFTSASTGKVSNSTSAPEKRKNDSSNAVTIIVVCVVVAILILCGILGFIFYKRKRCSATAESKERDSPIAQSSENGLNPIYSSADDNPTSSFSGGEAPTYQEPPSGASQECELYEPGEVHVYQYTDVKENDNHLPLQENEHEYAKTGAVEYRGKESTGKDQSQSPVYQTLEDPEHL